MIELAGSDQKEFSVRFKPWLVVFGRKCGDWQGQDRLSVLRRAQQLSMQHALSGVGRQLIGSTSYFSLVKGDVQS